MKIGLIAMSGIRACDPELLELGLTLPGFVERSKAIAALPSLGLLTLAGMTPAEHEVCYFEIDDLRQADALPDDLDLAAISTFTAQAPEAYRLIGQLRASGVPCVMGGLHTTALPHEAVAAGASAVVGEGELVWRQVLLDAARGEMKPIYDARYRGEFDLADAPMPAYHLLDMDRYNRITVQTARGCPWRCSFCASSILLTDRYKQKPAARVLAEVDAIVERWRRPFIELADDNAFVNRRYWRELLPELAERGIRWMAETDVSVAEDEALLHALREAGCMQVLIGFESPTPAGLDGVERRRNWKLGQRERYRAAIERIQRAGIMVNACFVVGLDGHDTRVFDDVYDFAVDAAPYDVQITYPTPLPGTPMYREFKAAGRLTHDGRWERYTLFDVNFAPDPMTAAELRAGFHGLVRRLYNAEFTAWRRQTFKDRFLHHADAHRSGSADAPAPDPDSAAA